MQATVDRPGLTEQVTAEDGSGPRVRRAWRRGAAYVLGIAVAVALPLAAFRGVDLRQSWDLLRGATAGLLLPAGGALLFSVCLRAWRWRSMLQTYADVRTRSCLSATFVGCLANNVLPLRLGELVRARSLRQLEGVSTATVLCTLAIERVADMIALTLLMVGSLALSLAGEHRDELAVAACLALAGCAAAIVVLGVGYQWRDGVSRLLTAPLRLVGHGLDVKAAELVKRFLTGMEVAASGRRLLHLGLLSLALWGTVVLFGYLVGEALHLGLGPAQYTVVLFTAAFAAVLPGAPGAVGTFHGLVCLGLYFVGVRDPAAALAYAAALHGIEWVLVNVTGAYFLLSDGLAIVGPNAAAGWGRPGPTPEPAR